MGRKGKDKVWQKKKPPPVQQHTVARELMRQVLLPEE